MKKYIEANENLEDFEIRDAVLVKYYGDANHVRIPDDVKEIAYEAFYQNLTLRSIDLNDVEIIDSLAFSECKNLTTVVGSKVKLIYGFAFTYCIHLQHIDLPSVKILDEFAFENCNSLVVADLRRAKNRHMGISELQKFN